MKKLFFVIGALIVTAGMSSCEKNYTCTCVYPGAAVGTSKTEFKAKKKGDAETSCGNLNAAAKLQGGSCAL